MPAENLTPMGNRPRHILAVEDEDLAAFLLMRAFQKSSLAHSISRVANGKEAVDYLAGTGAYSDRTLFPLPHLVLLDLNMPKMGGFEVLAWLRTRPDLDQLPVVVLSCSPLLEDIAKAQELGATDYKVKPVQLNDLVRLLHKLHDRYLSAPSEH